MIPAADSARFPQGLLEWSGNRAGGVRRMFHQDGGRPAGEVIQTPLISRLGAWVDQLATSDPDAPRAVMLVGGPGNGKTEAVEQTLEQLDHHLRARGALLAVLAPLFVPSGGKPVPRRAKIDLSQVPGLRLKKRLWVVQDASVKDEAFPGMGPPALLVQDLDELAEDDGQTVYLACVNRGILDDALAIATERKRNAPRTLLSEIVSAVSLVPSAPRCWPLKGHPHVAIWPMDVESLVHIDSVSGTAAPVEQLLGIATSAAEWPAPESCPAGNRCPFCGSRSSLEDGPQRTALVKILAWYELAAGKRWSFRDLFSLLPYLLAGAPSADAERALGPCDWAAKMVNIQSGGPSRNESLRLKAPFLLVAAQYQHALFGAWPRLGGHGLRPDLRELRLEHDPGLLGLHYFLGGARGASIPATLHPQLASLCAILDPAMASPDEDVALSAQTTVKLWEIDSRFSQSVGDGLRYMRKYRCLSKLELDVLALLADSDATLSDNDVRRRRPAIATRLQMLVRDFSCRMVRRSLGVRSAVVRDADTLRRFERVVAGDELLLHEASKQVEGLLNERDRFVVTLNTTFGEPLPPPTRQAVLTTDKQRVRPKPQDMVGRPSSALRFLSVGAGHSMQSIPLTYELFKSAGELRVGMLPASLPRPVVALLDTTRARLAGSVVRDEALLEGAEIRVGLREDVIARELGKFIVRQDGAQ